MCCQLTKRDSNARTILKDSVRKLVPSHYKLKRSGKPEVNAKRIKSLLTNAAFHSKVIPPTVTNVRLTKPSQTVKDVPYLFENRIIRAVISDMWFSDGLESYGVKYTEYFNPISLSTIALVTTMVSS